MENDDSVTIVSSEVFDAMLASLDEPYVPNDASIRAVRRHRELFGRAG